MSAAGWMADVIVACIVIAFACLIDATGLITTIICGQAVFQSFYSLLLVTGDGRNTFRYLWLSAKSVRSSPLPWVGTPQDPDAF